MTRETVYIQAGELSNYIGTHFWNTQETYFTYDGEETTRPLSAVNHDVSFREGLSPMNNTPTFCPRLLLFDFKSNFGALPRVNELYAVTDILEDDETIETWPGEISRNEQPMIELSDYQRALAEEDMEINGEGSLTSIPPPSVMRYWSDYNRVYYHPRSTHRLPDLPEWKGTSPDWSASSELFTRMNNDMNVMEEAFRQFMEECDNVGGVQLTCDSNTMSGFSASLLEEIRDEYEAKLPILSFPILSGCTPSRMVDEEETSLANLINDARYLVQLSEYSTLSVPLVNPLSWSRSRWMDNLKIGLDNLYQTSAILSAHIETATLPLRLRDPSVAVTMATLAEQLIWREPSRFASLGGILPWKCEGMDLWHDFTLDGDPFGGALSCSTTLRGVSAHDTSFVREWLSSFDLGEPFLTMNTSDPYPTPSSFPSSIFPNHPPQVPVSMASALYSTSMTAIRFGGYARIVEREVRRRSSVLRTVLAIEDEDNGRELVERLWGLGDNSPGEDESGNGLGEDEL